MQWKLQRFCYFRMLLKKKKNDGLKLEDLGKKKNRAVESVFKLYILILNIVINIVKAFIKSAMI